MSIELARDHREAHASHRQPVAVCFAVVVVAILFTSLAQRYFGHAMQSPDLDFYDYYFAATVVKTDAQAPLYAGATDGNPQLRSAPSSAPIARVAQANAIADTELYLYPPLFADLLTPLTRLPLLRAAQLWRAINLFAVFGSVLLLMRAMRFPALSITVALSVALSLACLPVHEAISLGQIAPVLLALWSIGIVALEADMPLFSAFVFALATCFKVTPLLLVPLFLLGKQWRWLGGYVTSLVAMIVVMFAWNGVGNMRSFAQVIPAMGGTLPALPNKCLGSVLGWIYYGRVFSVVSVHEVLGKTPHGLELGAKAVNAAFFALCLYFAWKRSRSSLNDERAVSVATFALVTAVISPVSWQHGYVVALAPFLVFWVAAFRTRVSAVFLGTLTCATLATGALIFDLAAQARFPEPIRILFASVWPVSCALLCLLVLRSEEPLRLVPEEPA